jgi:hypothetical protein
MKERFCENRLHGCGRMFLAFTYKLRKKQGACVIPQNVTQWRMVWRNVHRRVTRPGKEVGYHRVVRISIGKGSGKEVEKGGWV